MAEQKPTLPNGFIGAQPRFSELKLKTDSHKSSQIKVHGQNTEWIKIKTEDPVKVGYLLYIDFFVMTFVLFFFFFFFFL